MLFDVCVTLFFRRLSSTVLFWKDSNITRQLQHSTNGATVVRSTASISIPKKKRTALRRRCLPHWRCWPVSGGQNTLGLVQIVRAQKSHFQPPSLHLHTAHRLNLLYQTPFPQRVRTVWMSPATSFVTMCRCQIVLWILCIWQLWLLVPA